MMPSDQQNCYWNFWVLNEAFGLFCFFFSSLEHVESSCNYSNTRWGKVQQTWKNTFRSGWTSLDTLLRCGKHWLSASRVWCQMTACCGTVQVDSVTSICNFIYAVAHFILLCLFYCCTSHGSRIECVIAPTGPKLSMRFLILFIFWLPDFNFNYFVSAVVSRTRPYLSPMSA